MDIERFLKGASDTPDWHRETPRRFWDPSRKLLKSIRDYQSARGPLRIPQKKIAVLRHRFWSTVCACDIPLNCQLGGGLLLPHTQGIVIHPAAEIGPNCTIFQQVTITEGCRLSGKVDIGAGAKLLKVEVGKYVAIGANAVVTKPLPDYSVAMGIPAKWRPLDDAALACPDRVKIAI